MELKKRAWTEINLDALANNIKNIRDVYKRQDLSFEAICVFYLRTITFFCRSKENKARYFM